MLRIRLFGHLQLAVDSRAVPFSALPKTTPLLAYLLLHRDRSIPRDLLAGLLWGDVRQGEALANLRRHLHDLRRALPPPPEAVPWVIAKGAALQWNPAAACWLDVAEFERLGGRPGHLAEAVELYTGDLLPEVYEDWCRAPRDRLRGLYLAALTRLVADGRARGDYPAAIDYARRGLRHDPLHEPLGRALVALLYVGGDRAGAVQSYRALAERLQADLGVDPMPETRAVYRAVVENAPAAEVLALAAGEPVRALDAVAGAWARAGDAPLEAFRTDPASWRPSNLPAPLTSFVGRAAEVAAIYRSIGAADSAVRLLTLTGPGGAGKTRLSQEAGARMVMERADVFPDGVFLIDLSALTQPDRVLPSISEALGLVALGSGSRVEALKAFLAQKRMLLILDNFEQVAEAAPQVALLLAHAPGLRLLVTSRAPLHVYGEHELPVPPLALPTLAPLPSTSALADFAAIALFVDRARALNPAFALTSANAAAVAELCVRFDGLPLAIELVAAHIKLFPPTDLLARLGDRPNALSSRGRDTPARHRSLHDVVAWSYRLLDAPAQALFARLAVFVGGFDLDAAEAVAGEAVAGDDAAHALAEKPTAAAPERSRSRVDGPPRPIDGRQGLVDRPRDPIDVASGLALLLDHNLIRSMVPPRPDAGLRLGMLITLRDFALDQLEQRGEADAYRRLHAAHFLELAEQAAVGMHLAEARTDWLDHCELEHDNLRAALAWAIGAGETETALRLAIALAEFWDVRGHITEGRRWLDQVLALAPGADSPRRGVALRHAGSLALRQNDYAVAMAHHQQSLAIAEAAGDPLEVARSLHGLGLSHEEPEILRDCVERALAMYRTHGDPSGIANCLQSLGSLAGRSGDHQGAQAIYAQCLALRRRNGETWAIDPILNNLGVLAQVLGEFETAERLHCEALARRRAAGFKHGVAQSLHNLGLVVALRGDHRAAGALYRESLALHWEIGSLIGLAECLEGLASVAAQRHDDVQAAELFGAVAALVASLGIHTGSRWAPGAHTDLDVVIDGVRRALGEARFMAASESGRAMPLAEVVRRAVADVGL